MDPCKTEASSQVIQQQEARFMWSQMLLETLLSIQSPNSQSTEEKYKDALDECLRFYNGNQKQLDLINEFVRSYTPHQVIHWYTRDTFFYRLLNKALRTQNILVIYKFLFLIQDIYR